MELAEAGGRAAQDAVQAARRRGGRAGRVGRVGQGGWDGAGGDVLCWQGVGILAERLVSVWSKEEGERVV
jgi:hypothetical protein